MLKVKTTVRGSGLHPEERGAKRFRFFDGLVYDGKIERRAISLGTDRGTDVAVLGGLSPGDSLVVKGPENLHDGDKVEVRR